MGALLGALCGVGLGLVLDLLPKMRQKSGREGRITALLRRAELSNVRPVQILGAAVAIFVFVFLVLLATTRTWAVATIVGGALSATPIGWLKVRGARIDKARREIWPDVIDDILTGIQAGLSLSDTMVGLARNGPEPLRAQMRQFSADLAATGRFEASLDLLKDRLKDPVADRIIEAMRIAHNVGGADLSALLRALSHMLREDARTRGELEARQSWTVNGARLAVVAPWLVVTVLCLQPSTARAYQNFGGVVVLASGAVLSAVAYYLMHKFATLTGEERTLA
ncbi:MAG: type II secretion system F family protein [Actinomycetaceae bacterium]|nr:type II secretion system F family protein [Actinomycetaceae bacterium]